MDEAIRPYYNPGPGEIVKDSIDALGWDMNEFRRRSNLSDNEISNLLHNTIPVSPSTADVLGSLFNTTASLWLNLDAVHRLRKLKDRLLG